jgi:hypothetical protein
MTQACRIAINAKKGELLVLPLVKFLQLLDIDRPRKTGFATHSQRLYCISVEKMSEKVMNNVQKA